MRHIITLALLLVAVLTKADEPKFCATLVPVEKIHDFGTIEEKDGIATCEFTLINKGKQTAVITDVNAWCGCTSADFTKQAILPGKSATIKVSYNPAYRPGKFSKEVHVILNDGKEFVRLWIKGSVNGVDHPVTEDFPYSYGYGFYARQEVVPFPHLKQGESYSMSLGIANDTDKPMTVEFVRKPNNQVLKMPATVFLQPKERSKIKISYRAPKERKYKSYIYVYPVINGKTSKKPLKVVWY